MKLSTIFRRLDRLYADKHRWIKGEYRDKRGPRRKECFCLAGGANKVAGVDVALSAYEIPHGVALKTAIQQLFKAPSWQSVEGWNDKPYRTISDVRRVVKRALRNAERAEAKAA